MKNLQQTIDALKRFQNETDGLIQEIIKDHDYIVIDMNVEDQLYERGVDSRGVELSQANPYTSLTMTYKAIKNQPTDRVTLRDTGEFHRSFELRFTNVGFEIVALDIKAESLMDKYGDQILGLTTENLEELQKSYIAPLLKETLIQWLSN